MNVENMDQNLIEIVREAQGGSQRAWNMLVEKFQRKVFSMALVITKDIHDADDVTQDVFVKLYKSLGTLREPEKIDKWLAKTSINKAKDLCRRRKVRQWLPLFKVQEAEPSTAEKDVYLNELKEIFKTWRESKLSQKEQLVFQLRFGQEKELHEIAEILNMNVNTVKTHLHRAVKKLRPEAAKLTKGGRQ